MGGLGDFFGGLLESTKSMFIKEDGGIKWGSLIGIGVGATAGWFLFPQVALIGAVVGSIGGLMGSQLIERFMPSSAPAPAPVVRGGAHTPDPHAHHDNGLPAAQQTPAGRVNPAAAPHR